MVQSRCFDLLLFANSLQIAKGFYPVKKCGRLLMKRQKGIKTSMDKTVVVCVNMI